MKESFQMYMDVLGLCVKVLVAAEVSSVRRDQELPLYLTELN